MANKAKTKRNGKAATAANKEAMRAKAKEFADFRNRKLKEAQATDAGTEVIEFETAVHECEQVFAKFEGSVRATNMRLGEIAAKCETKYDDETINKLGKRLEAKLADKEWAGVFSAAGKVKAGDGVAECTLARMLKRNRSVWRAWDGAGIKAPAPVSWAVLMELQGHPGREALVNANPDMTKAEAREHMQKHKDEANDKDKDDQDKDDQDQDDQDQDDQDDDQDHDDAADKDNKDKDWQTKHTERWFKRLLTLANEIEDVATEYPKDPNVVRAHASVKTLPRAEAAGKAWCRLVERLEKDICGEEEAAEENTEQVAKSEEAAAPAPVA